MWVNDTETPVGYANRAMTEKQRLQMENEALQKQNELANQQMQGQLQQFQQIQKEVAQYPEMGARYQQMVDRRTKGLTTDWAQQAPKNAIASGYLQWYQSQAGDIQKLLPMEGLAIREHSPMAYMPLNKEAAQKWEAFAAADAAPDRPVKQDPSALMQYLEEGGWEAVKQGHALARRQAANKFKFATHVLDGTLVGMPIKGVIEVANKINPEYGEAIRQKLGVDSTEAVVGNMIGLALGYGKILKGAQWAAGRLGYTGWAAGVRPGLGGFLARQAPQAAATATQLSLLTHFQSQKGFFDVSPSQLAGAAGIGAAADIVLTGLFRGVGNLLKLKPLTIADAGGAAKVMGIGGGIYGAGRGFFGDWERDKGFLGRGWDTVSGGFMGASLGAAAPKVAFAGVRTLGNVENLKNFGRLFAESDTVLATRHYLKNTGVKIEHLVEEGRRLGERIGLSPSNFEKLYATAKSFGKGNDAARAKVVENLAEVVEGAAKSKNITPGETTVKEVGHYVQETLPKIRFNVRSEGTALNLEGTKAFDGTRAFHNAVKEQINKLKNLTATEKNKAVKIFDQAAFPLQAPSSNAIADEGMTAILRGSPNLRNHIRAYRDEIFKAESSAGLNASGNQVLQQFIKQNPKIAGEALDSVSTYLRTRESMRVFGKAFVDVFPDVAREARGTVLSQSTFGSAQAFIGMGPKEAARYAQTLELLKSSIRKNPGADFKTRKRLMYEAHKKVSGDPIERFRLRAFIDEAWKKQLALARRARRSRKAQDPLMFKDIEDISQELRKKYNDLDMFHDPSLRKSVEAVYNVLKHNKYKWATDIKGAAYAKRLRSFDELKLKEDTYRSIADATEGMGFTTKAQQGVGATYRAMGFADWKTRAATGIIDETLAKFTPRRLSADETFRRTFSERARAYVGMHGATPAGNPMSPEGVMGKIKETVIKQKVLIDDVKDFLSISPAMKTRGTLDLIFDNPDKYKIPIQEEAQ